MNCYKLDCLRAINVSLILVAGAPGLQVAFRYRKTFETRNVLAVYSFDMLFFYILVS